MYLESYFVIFVSIVQTTALLFAQAMWETNGPLALLFIFVGLNPVFLLHLKDVQWTIQIGERSIQPTIKPSISYICSLITIGSLVSILAIHLDRLSSTMVVLNMGILIATAYNVFKDYDKMWRSAANIYMSLTVEDISRQLRRTMYIEVLKTTRVNYVVNSQNGAHVPPVA